MPHSCCHSTVKKDGCFSLEASLHNEHIETMQIPFFCSASWVKQTLLGPGYLKHFTFVGTTLFQIDFQGPWWSTYKHVTFKMIVLMNCDSHVLVYLHMRRMEKSPSLYLLFPIFVCWVLVCFGALGEGMMKMKHLVLPEGLCIFSFIFIFFSWILLFFF